MARLDQGHVVISVDSASLTGRSAGGTVLQVQRQALDNGRQLLQRLNQHRLKATWALSDPAHSPFVGVLKEAKLPQEVALIGDVDWVGKAAGRTRFALELQRRVLSARQAGQDVQTLVLAGVSLEEGFDLLVKSRISVVRQDVVHSPRETRIADRKAGAFRPQSLRFGIWQAPPAFRVSQRQSSWLRSPASALKRLVRNAATQQQVAHVVVDLELLKPRDLAGLGQWFALLAKHQAAQEIRVRTLGEFGAYLNQPAQHPSSQSILRKVA